MSSTHEDADSPSPPAAPSRRITWMLNLGLVVGAIVAGIAWHRAQDPSRRWVARIEQGHAQHMDRPLQRCFGTTDPAAIRRLADALLRGRMTPPLSECHRGPAAELLVSPEAQGQPNDQQRERIAQRIESLSAEIAAEQRALSDLLTAARDAASPL